MLLWINNKIVQAILNNIILMSAFKAKIYVNILEYYIRQ
jgi:hypothetical protein